MARQGKTRGQKYVGEVEDNERAHGRVQERDVEDGS